MVAARAIGIILKVLTTVMRHVECQSLTDESSHQVVPCTLLAIWPVVTSLFCKCDIFPFNDIESVVVFVQGKGLCIA